MEDVCSASDTRAPTEILLAWHKPQIERIIVALDTANEKGSGPDAVTHGPEFA